MKKPGTTYKEHIMYDESKNKSYEHVGLKTDGGFLWNPWNPQMKQKKSDEFRNKLATSGEATAMDLRLGLVVNC